MKSNSRTDYGLFKIGALYKLSAIKRSIIIWLCFQGILWIIFGISYITNKEAWLNVIIVDPAVVAAVGGWWSTLFYIIISNSIICILIIIGNVFVRFSYITPGLLVIAIQAVMIGWLAGSNGFEIPFKTVADANIQYLRIGLWETTAYALICAVSLPKSLLIAETFPAKEWTQQRSFKDNKLSIDEIIISVLSAIMLISAAIIETFEILG